MTDLDINTQLTVATEDATLTAWLNALEVIGIPANSWPKANTARSILRVMAATYTAVANLVVTIVQTGFLETASGVWLTFLAYYVYGVLRPGGTYANGNETLQNTGGGSYGPFAPGELVILNPTSKQSYQNTTTITIPPGMPATLFPFTALQSGAIGTSVGGTITAFQTPLNGVTATNATDFVGLDPMSDDDLKSLCKAQMASTSPNGPRDSYDFACRNATNPVTLAPVNINRTAISRSSSTGKVTITVASPAGAPDPNDLLGCQNNVAATSVPDTVTATVLGATVSLTTETINVYALQPPGGGVSASDVQSAVQAAIAKLVSVYPIGGIAKVKGGATNLWASDLTGAAVASFPGIYAVDGFTDIALVPPGVGSPGEVATITLVVTVTLFTPGTL